MRPQLIEHPAARGTNNALVPLIPRWLPQHPNAEIEMIVVIKAREIPGVRTGQVTRRYSQISSLPDSLRDTHRRARPPTGIMLGPKGTAAADESYGFHFDKLNAPSGQILIKTAGIGEHLPHVSDLTRVPATNILIKSRSTIEHSPHESDLTRVPATNILIKSRSTFEHTPHASDLTRVPATNILIESRSTIEHVPHAGDLTRVPRPYGSIELRSAFEHPAHTHDRSRIPAVKILVEGTRITEHALHRCDRAGIPAADILIERTRTIEHSAHQCDFTSLPTANILVKRTRTTEHACHHRHSTGVPRTNIMIEPSSIHEHIAQVRHALWQFLWNLGQVDCPVESTIEARNPQIAPGRHSQHSLTAIMGKDAGTKASPCLQCPNDINHILARHQILVPWTTWISKHLHSAITPIHSHLTVAIQAQLKLTNTGESGVNQHGERITHRNGSGGRNTRINDTHRRDDGGTRANPRNQACRIDSRNTPVTTLPVNILRNVTVNTHHQVQLPRCTRKELQLNRTDIYSQHLSRTLNRDDYRSGSAAAPLIHHAISEFNRLTLTPGKRIKRTERIERDQASIGIKSHVRNRFNAADRQHTTGRTHVIRQQLLNRQHQRQIIHRHCERIIHSHRANRRNYLNLMLSRHALTKAILNREHRNNRINGCIGVAQ